MTYIQALIILAAFFLICQCRLRFYHVHVFDKARLFEIFPLMLLTHTCSSSTRSDSIPSMPDNVTHVDLHTYSPLTYILPPTSSCPSQGRDWMECEALHDRWALRMARLFCCRPQVMAGQARTVNGVRFPNLGTLSRGLPRANEAVSAGMAGTTGTASMTPNSPAVIRTVCFFTEYLLTHAM